MTTICLLLSYFRTIYRQFETITLYEHYFRTYGWCIRVVVWLFKAIAVSLNQHLSFCTWHVYNFVVKLNETNIKRLQTRHNIVVFDCCIYPKRSASLGLHQHLHIHRKRTGRHSDIVINFEPEIVQYSVDNDAYAAGVMSTTSPYLYAADNVSLSRRMCT